MKVRIDFPLKHMGLSDIGLYGENDADFICTYGYGKSEWSQNLAKEIYGCCTKLGYEEELAKMIGIPLEILYKHHGKESFDFSLFEALLEFEYIRKSLAKDVEMILNRKQMKLILDMKAKYGDSISFCGWGSTRIVMNATAYDYLQKKANFQYKMEDVITRTKHLYAVTFDNF